MSQAVASRSRWRRASLAGMTVLAIAAASACSSASSGKSSSAAAGGQKLVSMTDAAKGPVDSLTWNLTSGEPDTLDPPSAATYGGGQVVMNLCDTLVRFDAEYNMTPGLATANQVSPTKLVYTLRSGATFWDGASVTAQDVAYSLTRAENGIVGIFFSSVKSIDVTGANEVTVTFKSPDEKFANEMGTIAGVVVEQKYAEKAGKNFGTAAGGLMCSGPFKLDKWASGDSITISRNDNYWDKSRLPKVKNVKFTFITDGTALVQALNTGEIDGAYELPPSAVPALQKSTVGHLYFGPSTQGVSMLVANPGGITADSDFMNGLERIVDRAGIAQAVYHGAAEPLYTMLTPRTWPTAQQAQYAAAAKQFEQSRAYDLATAKAQIAKSAYKGQQVVLAYQAGDPTSDQVVQLIQQEAKAAGVSIKLQSMGAQDFQQAGYTASKRQGIDLMYGSSFNSMADPMEPAQFDFFAGSPYNYTNFANAQAQDLLTKAGEEFDPAKRADLVIQAQKLYEQANVLVPVVSTDTVTFLNNRLAGAVTSFAYWVTPNMAWIGSSS